jgi:hypothetical protein
MLSVRFMVDMKIEERVSATGSISMRHLVVEFVLEKSYR